MKNILIPQGLGGSSHQISSFFLREKRHGHMSWKNNCGTICCYDMIKCNYSVATVPLWRYWTVTPFSYIRKSTSNIQKALRTSSHAEPEILMISPGFIFRQEGTNELSAVFTAWKLYHRKSDCQIDLWYWQIL